MDSGTGPELDQFESTLAEACRTAEAVGVSSGMVAKFLGLQAAGIGAGNDVFLPEHTFFTTASPMLWLSATPMFVDINPEAYTIDPDVLESAVTESGRSSCGDAGPYYGQMAETDATAEIVDRHHRRVVADVCQAHFAKRNGETAERVTDVDTFSFYPSKNMAVGGDGGMLMTDDELAERARALRNHGTGEPRTGSTDTSISTTDWTN